MMRLGKLGCGRMMKPARGSAALGTAGAVLPRS